jgi:hypothetical protein
VRPAVACLALAALAAASAVAGCRGSASPTDRRTARTVVAVVERNMTAAEAGDGRGYCAAFTERYLRGHFGGGYESCVRRFHGPAADIDASHDVRYLNADPPSDGAVRVHFTLGIGRKLDYVMKREDAPAGSPPPGKRWLIDGRAPFVED